MSCHLAAPGEELPGLESIIQNNVGKLVKLRLRAPAELSKTAKGSCNPGKCQFAFLPRGVNITACLLDDHLVIISQIHTSGIQEGLQCSGRSDHLGKS